MLRQQWRVVHYRDAVQLEYQSRERVLLDLPGVLTSASFAASPAVTSLSTVAATKSAAAIATAQPAQSAAQPAADCLRIAAVLGIWQDGHRQLVLERDHGAEQFPCSL